MTCIVYSLLIKQESAILAAICRCETMAISFWRINKMRPKGLALAVVLTLALYVVYFIYIKNVLCPTKEHKLRNLGALGLQKAGAKFYIAVVACGQRLHETLTMIKSALLFNKPKHSLHFLIFAENHLSRSFEKKLSDWRVLRRNEFNFDIFPLKFPKKNGSDWRTLFKPCAAQRLFLPSILQSFESLLYVDTDILFLSPVSDVWSFFGKFNSSQIAALTQEHLDPNIGWYNRFARHPYYGPLGVNSGVMLMNLTRMRKFQWEEKVLPIHKEYKLRITWGDQDILNILFYYHPETLFLFPCEYNYRPDHCMYMSVCNASLEGIKLLHGNRGYFHSSKQPLFRAIYEIIDNFPVDGNPYIDYLLPLREALEDPLIMDSSCGKLTKEAMQIANRLFVSS